jgi:hypothetical protein
MWSLNVKGTTRMSVDSYSYAPYFRNGLLYLPATTVEMLISAGLNQEIAISALNGLALDDKGRIGEISRAMEMMLADIEEDTQAFQTLTSEETQFMLTGKPSANV